MTAILWQPLLEGVQASIWLPGGPVPMGVCNLAAYTDVSIPGAIIEDFFVGTNGTVLNTHEPTYMGGIPFQATWAGSTELTLLDSSVVNSLAETDGGNYVSTACSVSDVVRTSTTVGVTDIGPFTAKVYYWLYDDAAHPADFGFNIVRTVQDGPIIATPYAVIAGVDAGEEGVLYGNPVELTYCGWHVLMASLDFNLSEITFNISGIEDAISLPGINFSAVNIEAVEMSIQLNNLIPNTFRIASMAITGYEAG